MAVPKLKIYKIRYMNFAYLAHYTQINLVLAGKQVCVKTKQF